MLWNKEKKHGLEFNPELVLIEQWPRRGVTFLSYFSLDWIIEISQFLVSIGKTLDEALLRRSAPTYDTIKTGCKKYLLVFFFQIFTGCS